MWDYKEESVVIDESSYIKIYLIDVMKEYGEDGWEIFQFEKEVVECESYGDRYKVTYYTLYMKKRIIE